MNNGKCLSEAEYKFRIFASAIFGIENKSDIYFYSNKYIWRGKYDNCRLDGFYSLLLSFVLVMRLFQLSWIQVAYKRMNERNDGKRRA